MRKERRLTKPEQFAAIYNEGRTQADRILVLKAKPNQLEFSRFGISVSKRVGSAVIRNRVKRVLREVLKVVPFTSGWDIVIIARNPAAESNYQQFKESVANLAARAHIAVGQ